MYRPVSCLALKVAIAWNLTDSTVAEGAVLLILVFGALRVGTQIAVHSVVCASNFVIRIVDSESILKSPTSFLVLPSVSRTTKQIQFVEVEVAVLLMPIYCCVFTSALIWTFGRIE